MPLLDLAKLQLELETSKPIRSYYGPLDALLKGGFEQGLYQIVGAPATGKTHILVKMCKKAHESGKKVLYCDTEGGVDLSVEEGRKRVYTLEELYDGLEQALAPCGGVESSDICHPPYDLCVIDSFAFLLRGRRNNSNNIDSKFGAGAQQRHIIWKILRLLKKVARVKIIVNHITRGMAYSYAAGTMYPTYGFGPQMVGTAALEDSVGAPGSERLEGKHQEPMLALTDGNDGNTNIGKSDARRDSFSGSGSTVSGGAVSSTGIENQGNWPALGGGSASSSSAPLGIITRHNTSLPMKKQRISTARHAAFEDDMFFSSDEESSDGEEQAGNDNYDQEQYHQEGRNFERSASSRGSLPLVPFTEPSSAHHQQEQSTSSSSPPAGTSAAQHRRNQLKTKPSLGTFLSHWCDHIIHLTGSDIILAKSMTLPMSFVSRTGGER